MAVRSAARGRMQMPRSRSAPRRGLRARSILPSYLLARIGLATVLTPTEMHYACGLLYLRARQADGTVTTMSGVLGEKVYDEAEDKSRDVDLVIATAGDTAFMGVEIKAEKRPLDVTTVEQICVKLSDMPSLRERFLVSASGFAEPARKKARHHGLGCLDLVRGTPPPIATADMSRVQSLTVERCSWLTDPKPDIRFNPTHNTSQSVLAGLSDATIFRFGDGGQMTKGPFLDWLMNRAMHSAHPGNQPSRPVRQVRRISMLLEPPVVTQLSHGDLAISEVLVTAVMDVQELPIPLYDSIYLRNEGGDVFAAALLFDVDGELWGFQMTGDRVLSAIRLRPEIRAIRPIRHSIG